MSAFITPQTDHQPLHIGAPDQHTRILDKKPTNSCFANSILKAGATLNQWEVAPSGPESDRLIIKNGNRTNRKHKYKPEFDSVDKKKSLVGNLVRMLSHLKASGPGLYGL